MPTIGLLLVAGRNDRIVRYTLSAATAPLAVADYTYEALPADARAVLPSAARLAAALDTTTPDTTTLTITGNRDR